MACYAYLTSEEAIAQIDDCERRNVLVLDIDVFTKTPTMTKPHLEHTLDMSRLTDVAAMASAARDHVMRLAVFPFHFEVIADED